MKLFNTTAILMLATSISLSAAANTIPNSFHGFWEEADFCAMAIEVGAPNIGAVISATEVHGYENHCEVKTVTEQAADTIEVSLKCMQEGDEHDEMLELRRIDNKYLVISRDGDKTWPLVRCD